MKTTSARVVRLGQDKFGIIGGLDKGKSALDRVYKSMFGMGYKCIALLWNYMDDRTANGLAHNELKYFMATLLFLKVYCTFDVLSTVLECHTNSASHWVWLYLHRLAMLNDLVSHFLWLSFDL